MVVSPETIQRHFISKVMLQKQFLQKVLTRYITTLMYFLSHHKNRRSTSDLETAEFPHCAECSANPSSSPHCTVLRDVTRSKGKETGPEASVHSPVQPAQTAARCKLGLVRGGKGARTVLGQEERRAREAPRCSAILTRKESTVTSTPVQQVCGFHPALGPVCSHSHRKRQAHGRNCRFGDRLSKGTCVYTYTCTHTHIHTHTHAHCMGPGLHA